MELMPKATLPMYWSFRDGGLWYLSIALVAFILTSYRWVLINLRFAEWRFDPEGCDEVVVKPGGEAIPTPGT